MLVYTISASNYFQKAMATLESHRRYNPQDKHMLVLCERHENIKGLPIPPWLETRTIFDVGVPDPERLAFSYNLLELATAIKPFVFRDLFASGEKAATYIDPDIRIYRELYDVDTFASDAVVTPHLTDERPDGLFPTLHHVLKCGLFNFGYLSLRNTRNTGGFLAWWADTLLTQCVKNPTDGVFVDQSWGAAITSLMDKVHIERRHGSHAAYWNLRDGDVGRDDKGAYTVRGQPLTMFHFSGHDPFNPLRLSCHSERFNPVPKKSALEALVLEHARDIQRRCHAFEARKMPYSFDTYTDGQRIAMEDRRAVLNHKGTLASSPFGGKPGLPVAKQAGFREAYVKRTWQVLGLIGSSGTPCRLAVYGAGKHLDWLAHTVAGINPAPQVAAILDDALNDTRGLLGVKKSTRPEDHRPGAFDTVLISTDVPATAERMLKRARAVFGVDMRIFNLYEGCPKGQYI